MTGTRFVWTVAAKEYPLLTRHGSGLMVGGAGLPVPDRRDNYRIVREVRVVAAAVMVHDWHPVQEYCCSRSRMLIGRRLHSLAILSYQPVSPILCFVPVHQEFRLHFPLRFPEKIPCFLLHQHVRYCRHLIDQKSLLTDLMRERIRHWYSPAWFAYACRSYPGDPALHWGSLLQDLAEPATAKRHYYRYRSPTLSPRSRSSAVKIRIDRHGQPGLAGI